VDGLPCWSLIGRIGNGAPFKIGDSATHAVSSPGELYLGVDDQANAFGDNSGSWTVQASWTSAIAPINPDGNWAGYTAWGHGPYSTAYARWQQQPVSGSVTVQKAAFWVGIGGGLPGDTTLVQCGTYATTSLLGTSYTAFWETIPGGEHDIGHPVKPGDEITAKVGYENGTMTVSVQDNMKAGGVWAFVRNVGGGWQRDTAEVMAERPSLTISILSWQKDFLYNLANFGTETFTNAALGPNGLAEPITAVNGSGKVLISVGAPTDTASGATFSVTWHGSN
jgi:Peptidase A4 family